MGGNLEHGKPQDGTKDGHVLKQVHQDSFYKPLTPEQSQAAFRNEFDFDAPEAIDFDILVDRLKDIKKGYAIS